MQPPHRHERGMKKERKRERIFYTACHFAAVFIQISRRHFRDSMSREQSADVSIVANLRWKKTRKRREKRAILSESSLKKKKKNVRAGGISFDGAGSAGYFVLAVEIERLAMHLGNSVHEHRSRSFIVRQPGWYMAETIPPRGNVISDRDGPGNLPAIRTTFLSRGNALVYFQLTRRRKKITIEGRISMMEKNDNVID